MRTRVQSGGARRAANRGREAGRPGADVAGGGLEAARVGLGGVGLGAEGRDGDVESRRRDNGSAKPVGGWLRAMRDPWPLAVSRLLEGGEPAAVRVLVAEIRGSAPREPGTCMLVTHTDTLGTIGGGNLEWQAARAARALLSAGPSTRAVQVRRLVLSRELGQCCGGIVQLWLERFTHADLPMLRQIMRSEDSGAVLTEFVGGEVVRRLLPIGEVTDRRLRFTSTDDDRASLVEPLEKGRPALWLYGAGHVGQALIHILADLPFDVTWVDSRRGLFPNSLPDTVQPVCARTPATTVDSAPANALFLVMTHDHALDYEICRRVLDRGTFAWLGLIGSKSKGARFRSRLARDGIPGEQIARLTCPIGIEGVNSKLPAAIAVAVAAQLLRGVSSPAWQAIAVAETVGAAPAGSAAVPADTCTSTDCHSCASRRPTTKWVDP